MKKLLLLFVLVLFVGCGGGGPTLDTSSEESLKASMKAMSETLSEEDQKRFAACMQFGRFKQFQAAGEGKELQYHEALKDSHGLTAQQIIAKIEAKFKPAK